MGSIVLDQGSTGRGDGFPVLATGRVHSVLTSPRKKYYYSIMVFGKIKIKLSKRKRILTINRILWLFLLAFFLSIASCDLLEQCTDPNYPTDCKAHSTCCGADSFCCPEGTATKCCPKLNDCCTTTAGCCQPGTVCIGAACFYVSDNGDLVFVQDAEPSIDRFVSR